METYPLRLRKDLSARGFTMLEVMVAIFVMTVGLVALSALAAKTMSGTESSRFAGLAANLASEKLEDLNRWPYWDPNVYVAAGSTAGGLTSDVQASVTSGITETVNYYDDVSIGNASGAVTETVLGLVGGTEKYTTLTHNPDGTLSQTQTTALPAAAANAATFHRRWIIEMDQPVTGVKRITVLVTLTNSVINPPVSFQMSMVRTAAP
jgi:prepilin-type N-terminal cleavage/methylation domain-containing protein